MDTTSVLVRKNILFATTDQVRQSFKEDQGHCSCNNDVLTFDFQKPLPISKLAIVLPLHTIKGICMCIILAYIHLILQNHSCIYGMEQKEEEAPKI